MRRCCIVPSRRQRPLCRHARTGLPGRRCTFCLTTRHCHPRVTTIRSRVGPLWPSLIAQFGSSARMYGRLGAIAEITRSRTTQRPHRVSAPETTNASLRSSWQFWPNEPTTPRTLTKRLTTTDPWNQSFDGRARRLEIRRRELLALDVPGQLRTPRAQARSVRCLRRQRVSAGEVAAEPRRPKACRW